MKTAIIVFAIAIPIIIFSFFTSIGFYQIIIFPLACFFLLIVYAFFRGNKNQTRIKHLLLASSLIYITLSLVWPIYIAFHPPGFPPVNVHRFANLLVLSSFVFAMFSSDWFRKELANSFLNAKLFWIFFGTLVFFRIASVFVSKNPFSSMYTLMSDLFVHWFFIFAGLVIGSSRQNLLLFSKIIACCFFINFLLILPEFALGKNLFTPFVKDPNDPSVGFIMKEKLRGGLYRVQTVFTHPLVFAEFSSATFCFAVFVLSHIKNSFRRNAAIFFTIICASAMGILSGSRTGYVAIAIAISLAIFSPLVNSLFRGKMNLKIAALWSFLIIVLTISISALGFLIYDYVLGKHTDTGSNMARIVMMEQTFVKLFESPISPIFGYGPGLGAELVGVYVGGVSSAFTIDSLFISYTIESGLFAVLSFITLLIIGAVKAFRISLFGEEKDWFLWYAIGLSIISFLLFKSILSLTENNFLLFVLLGISVSGAAQSGSMQKIIRRV